jgi:hypothetical protein
MKIFRTDRPLAPAFSLVGPSLRLLREHIWPVFYLGFLPILILTIGIVLLTSRVNPETGAFTVFDDREIAGVIITITGAMAAIAAFPGLLYLQLQAIKKKSPTALESVQAGLPRLPALIVLGILESMLIVGGLILFIIPGLILLRKFFLSQYYVIDKKMGPIAAMKQSMKDSNPNAGPIWTVIGVSFLFGILSSFVGYVPVIGYIASLIVSFLYVFAPAFRYGEIVHNHKVELQES